MTNSKHLVAKINDHLDELNYIVKDMAENYTYVAPQHKEPMKEFMSVIEQQLFTTKGIAKSLTNGIKYHNTRKYTDTN